MPDGQLHFDKPSLNIVPHPPKGSFLKTMLNPNVKVSHNYYIIEDLAEALLTIFALEVLQNFPMQRNTLLSAISGVDPSYSNIMTFDPSIWKPFLSHHLAF